MHSNNSRIQILLTLGEPRIFSSDQWPDYVSQYGFTTDDVSALLALVADESIDTLPETRSEVWAPVYAWRILGQLGSEAAIAPLIGSFDRFCHDDCALSELYKVIAMLGPAAIPVLVQHWQQPDKDEFSHVLAMDALSEIATQHPATRAQILNIFRAYMLNPATSAHTLHGLLMGRLLDLKATEAIEEIRHLFALNCVDTTCAGDLEEVEIELGFRTERSTPQKHYALHASGEPQLSETAGFDAGDVEHRDDDAGYGIDADLAASFDLLDDYLLQYGSDEAILGASELDGYFAAMACAPTTILPSTWLPAIWGGEQYMPQWESEHELQEFSNAVFRHYNSVMQDFLEDDYEPQFLVSEIAATEVLLVDDWCEGFLRGVALWENLPADAAAKLEHWLAPIRLFGTKASHATLAAMNEPDIVQAQSSIEPNVKSMRRHLFNPVRRAGTFVHAAPKTGRNDLCPCGSGKKYKKCCGLH